jgi:hypothetical protein
MIVANLSLPLWIETFTMRRHDSGQNYPLRINEAADASKSLNELTRSSSVRSTQFTLKGECMT